MAKKQKPQKKNTKTKQKEKVKKTKPVEEKPAYKPLDRSFDESLVRILGNDIPGSRKILSGLTRIKGVGWALSNATCILLKLPKDKKISDLTKDEISKVENFLKNPEIKDFLKNRRKDRETGEDKHIVSVNLDMRKDFDIRRLKKIRSYKGVRHTAKLPVRGQRTRSNFRGKGKAVGVKRKKK